MTYITIRVKVVPRAHKNSVEKKDGVYIIRTTVVPESGKANMRAIALIAEHFGVGKSCVEIIRGHTSRHKVMCIAP